MYVCSIYYCLYIADSDEEPVFSEVVKRYKSYFLYEHHSASALQLEMHTKLLLEREAMYVLERNACLVAYSLIYS